MVSFMADASWPVRRVTVEQPLDNHQTTIMADASWPVRRVTVEQPLHNHQN